MIELQKEDPFLREMREYVLTPEGTMGSRDGAKSYGPGWNEDIDGALYQYRTI